MDFFIDSDKELEKRLHRIRSRVWILDDDEDIVTMSKLMEAEMMYMSDVIKQIVNNGTLDTCSLKNESSFPYKEELEDVIETLYDLTGTFYYVSRFE